MVTTDRISDDSASSLEVDEIAKRASVCLCTRVRQLSRLVTKVYDTAVRPLGITVSQFTLLSLIALHDGISQVEINAAFNIEKSTCAHNVERLVAIKLITMDPRAGRRRCGLHLTPKGVSIIKEAYPLWQDAQKKTTEALGTGTQKTLETLLNRLEHPATA